jgi:peptidoglycan/xylan/chitin deacetylase (PgdA/CDA1 family)
MFLVSALAVPVAVLGGAVPASAGTTVQPAPGTWQVLGVVCPTVTTCEAVGTNSSDQGVVLPIVNGAPGSAQVVPGTYSLRGVACASASTCEVVGQYSSGVVVPIVNGTAGSVQQIPGATDLSNVACTGTTTCEAVGGYSIGSGQAQVVPITNGSAGSARAVPGAFNLLGIACPSATTCEAVGTSSATSGHGVVVPIVNGTPGSPVAVSGTGELYGMVCPTVTTCEAVGTSPTGTQGVVVPIVNGVPGTVQVVPGTGNLAGVACQSVTTCEAVGSNSTLTQGVLVPIINGTPGSAQVVPGTVYLWGVACPSASICQATGWSKTGGVVAQVAIKTTVSLTFDNGAISQYTLGYQQALQPQGVKATFYLNTGVIGGANHLTWSQLAALQSAGQEIGGKTVDGTNLTTLSSSQQVAEICNDRQALISHGLNPVGFAYPAGAFNATIESEVQGCGYNNARTAGSLSPSGPAYAETLPPKDWLALRAYAPTGQVTLAHLEALVTGAASKGGGWDPVVIQKVCSQALDPSHYATCTSSSGWIDLSDLTSFLSWVHNAGQPGGAPAGTVFSPVGATATSLGLPPS